MTGNVWTTVAKRQLGKDSTTVFTLHLPDSMVRLAMSVNQAGAGYLGSTSHPLHTARSDRAPRGLGACRSAPGPLPSSAGMR